MGLTLKNVFVNCIYYAMTVVVLPALVLWVESKMGFPSRPSVGLRITGLAAAVAGIVLQAWCIVLFQRIGRGTPSPVFPTRALVTQGPYRYVRNPLNIGELLVFFGLAGWFGSVALLAYTLAAWIAFHAFVVLCEEPRNARAFGDEHAEYRRRVNRWLPRPRDGGRLA